VVEGEGHGIRIERFPKPPSTERQNTGVEL
jgi:hypothetical protein